MRKPILCALLPAVAAVAAAAAQEPSRSPDRLWAEVPSATVATMAAEPPGPEGPWEGPPAVRLYVLDGERLSAILAEAQARPLDDVAGPPPPEISIPMPDGSYAAFRLEPSQILAPELAAKFPDILTFRGQGIDDPTATVQIDSSQSGFHAQVLFPSRAVVVDPYRLDRGIYASYERGSAPTSRGFQCDVQRRRARPPGAAAAAPVPRGSGGALRRYRLAMAATGEYSAQHGGTVAGALRGMATTVARVSGIYERELAVQLQLVGDNDKLVFTDPERDPFINDSPHALICESQAVIDRTIGDAGYDIGHTLSTAGGGLAGLGVACRPGEKARGVTGTDQPSGDAFDVDFVAHEIGHQLGADHTFNGALGDCGRNRNEQTAFEPGSGSTILGYAGICKADDLQLHSNAYFHSVSLEQILDYIGTGGGDCGSLVRNANRPPTVRAGDDRVIPRQTPFKLSATGSDPDRHPLTFCWEERDLGPQARLGEPDDGKIPLFRSLEPTAQSDRRLPRLVDLVSGSRDPGESLPRLDRTLSFRVTARDNQAAGGAVAFDEVRVRVHAAAGPFEVTEPRGGRVPAGTTRIAWEVAGTRLPPVDSQFVNIFLSTDGGGRFVPLVLNTPNDGNERVTLPAIESAASHVMVESADNIFFAVSERFDLVRSQARAEAVPRDGAGEQP